MLLNNQNNTANHTTEQLFAVLFILAETTKKLQFRTAQYVPLNILLSHNESFTLHCKKSQ